MATAESTQRRREQRRAARREANRSQILDAAERVFGQVGVQNGSMREIAAEAGFSSAALYLFFESRQHLLVETMLRRADELIALLESITASEPEPMRALHTIIDETLAFHDHRRDFWRMLSQMRSGITVFGPELGPYASDAEARLASIHTLLARLVRTGQRRGTIRKGDPKVLARYYMVLNNEYVTMAIEGPRAPSAAEFHAFLDDGFRAGAAEKSRPIGR